MTEVTATTPRHQKNLQEGEKKIEKYIFSLNKVIGKGSYATVFLGRRIADDLPTAVKVIDKKIFVNTYNIKSIQSEIEIMKKMDHQNIVQLLDVYQTSNNMYIVTEFCEEGDLRMHIKKRGKLGEIQAVKILKDLLKGFKYLYEKEIIHRDLKPANILLSGDVCKISDFGFAKNLEYGENTVLRSIVGTPLYMSPQILNKQSYTGKSDLWSIGLIFYEMIYGHTPWPANNEIQLLNNIMTKGVPFNSEISEKSKDFIKRCLRIKEEDRMSWEEAFKHPVLASQGIQNKSANFSELEENKENRDNSLRKNSKSAKKRGPLIKGLHSRTPSKYQYPNTPSRNLTPNKHIGTSRNITPDRRSPWKF